MLVHADVGAGGWWGGVRRHRVPPRRTRVVRLCGFGSDVVSDDAQHQPSSTLLHAELQAHLEAVVEFLLEVEAEAQLN